MTDKATLLERLEDAAERVREAGFRGHGTVCKAIAEAVEALKAQETTFEKDGHHIRCTSCGNYWCDIDSEGNLFPHNYCPDCGRRVNDGSESMVLHTAQ